MVKFTLTTPYGNRYLIHDNGDIQRTDMDHKPSGQWKVLGLEHVKRNEFLPFEILTPALVRSLEMSYKNGNPQYTVRDLDHGTQRTWGKHEIPRSSSDLLRAGNPVTLRGPVTP